MSQFEIKQCDKSFFRPSQKDDMKYRKFILVTFEKRLKEVIDKDCTLCFHGTPIWNAKQIINSGNISSLIDRIGPGEDVLPMPGQISVSTINNLWFTVKYFADLFNYNYPAGCIFVIKPQDEQEVKSSVENNSINNVYFYKQPEQLVSIITTPENITTVKNWIKDSKLNISPEIVVDYEQFIEIAKSKYRPVLNTL